jgi:hypothetical protein
VLEAYSEKLDGGDKIQMLEDEETMFERKPGQDKSPAKSTPFHHVMQWVSAA